jgi:magnesium transporter
VVRDEQPATPWYVSLWRRHRWLQLNLITAFIAAAVVGLFQETIDRLLILTMFLPVLAGQSGNTGSQALAITLRGVFLGELELGRQKALIMKEALLGLLNGALVGIVAAMCMYVVAVVKHLPNALMLSAVVFLAMIGSCVISGACGAIMPLLLKKLGADPVIASSIFLTTATNVASMGLLLGLATVLVK